MTLCFMSFFMVFSCIFIEVVGIMATVLAFGALLGTMKNFGALVQGARRPRNPSETQISW